MLSTHSVDAVHTFRQAAACMVMMVGAGCSGAQASQRVGHPTWPPLAQPPAGLDRQQQATPACSRAAGSPQPGGARIKGAGSTTDLHMFTQPRCTNRSGAPASGMAAVTLSTLPGHTPSVAAERSEPLASCCPAGYTAILYRPQPRQCRPKNSRQAAPEPSFGFSGTELSPSAVQTQVHAEPSIRTNSK